MKGLVEVHHVLCVEDGERELERGRGGLPHVVLDRPDAEHLGERVEG